MRNIFNFVLRNNFWITFLCLLIFCLYLIFNHNHFHRSKFFNSANAVSSKIFSASNRLQSYVRLAEENEVLVKENARLRGLAYNSYHHVNGAVTKINDTNYKQIYAYISGRLINVTLNKQNNYFTISSGKSDGIEKDMGVISSNGIVGVVKDVSNNFSTVMSLLHKNFICNCKLKNEGISGPLIWDGVAYNKMQLTDIPTHAKLKKGDTVLTSHLTRMFPEGQMVGTVDSWERKQGEGFYTVNVLLSVDFKKLNSVYIVKYFYKAEQDSIEQHATQNDTRDN